LMPGLFSAAGKREATKFTGDVVLRPVVLDSTLVRNGVPLLVVVWVVVVVVVLFPAVVVVVVVVVLPVVDGVVVVLPCVDGVAVEGGVVFGGAVFVCAHDGAPLPRRATLTLKTTKEKERRMVPPWG